MTPRRLAFLTLVFGFLAVSVRGQGGGANDNVRYRDRSKDNQEFAKLGEAQESAAGIKILAGGKAVLTLSPADITSVFYGRLPGVEDNIRMEMPSWEGKGAAEARTKYAEVLKTAGDDPKTKKFLEYKDAWLSAKIADAKSGADFKAEADKAVAKLLGVVRTYPKSWEVWPCGRAAARLQAELGQFREAGATLAALAKVPDLPVELKVEARLAEVEALIRSGSSLAAAPAIADLAKATDVPGEGPLRDRLTVLQAIVKGAEDKGNTAKIAEAAAKVKAVIDRTSDTPVRAAAHNALGELYLMANQPEEAKWQFLWVEAVYNQDRDETSKAVGRLIDVFEKLNDADRAAAYREKLPKVKAGG